MKGDGGNNWSYEVWAASLLLGELMSSMKIKSPAQELAIRMLPLGFFFSSAGCQQVLENGILPQMMPDQPAVTRFLSSKGSRASRQGKCSVWSLPAFPKVWKLKGGQRPWCIPYVPLMWDAAGERKM